MVITADPMLEMLVLDTERSDDGAGPPIIVWVGGATVSGQLVSGWRFTELLVETMSNAIVRDDVGSPAELVARSDGPARMFAPFLERLPAGSGPEVVCLSGARDWTSGSPVPPDGMLWRCRVDRVDGWCIGERTATD